jgi:ABC-type polysaccharide/polyol phosphate export permease
MGPAWLLPLVALPLQTTAAYGLGLALAPLAALHAGLRPALASALTLLTFASPILYPESLLGEQARAMLEWNPFTHLLRFYRVPLGGDVSLGASDLAVAVAAPAACIGIGAFLKRRLWWAARDRL